MLLAVALMVTACSVTKPAEDATGEELYANLCENCHSADLSGRIGPDIGPGSPSATEPDEFLEFTIMNGRGRMPSFSSSLDETQLERLVGYIREVQDR
ncbi:MAG: c-type cytochrome [Acidimicrobiia bacterium]